MTPTRLSSPLESMRTRYDVVVVGSGYGGGVAACRLARAGRKVCVLERGRELQPGDYPNDTLSMLQEIQKEAARLDRSLSWIVQRCVKIGLSDIRKLPSVNDIPDGEDDDPK